MRAAVEVKACRDLEREVQEIDISVQYNSLYEKLVVAVVVI
jgi:hypothetical protein